MHGTALVIKELTNTNLQSASPGQRSDVRKESYQKNLIRKICVYPSIRQFESRTVLPIECAAITLFFLCLFL